MVPQICENYKLNMQIGFMIPDLTEALWGVLPSHSLRKNFIELRIRRFLKLRKTLDGVNSMDDWIRFFNAWTEEELDMIHTTNIGINTAISEVKKMSMSERMRAWYEAHMKEIRDRNAREDYVRKQGIEQGIEQGIKQGIKQGTHQMIENKFVTIVI